MRVTRSVVPAQKKKVLHRRFKRGSKGHSTFQSRSYSACLDFLERRKSYGDIPLLIHFIKCLTALEELISG